jgi:hypothetical protein
MSSLNHFCGDKSNSASQIIVTYDSLLSETEFKSSDSCSLRLIRSDKGINHGILKYHNRCNFDPQHHSILLNDMLKTIFTDSETDSIHTIAWGRLTPNLLMPSIFSQRLARTTYSQNTWDHVKGMPMNGHINDYVRDLLNKTEVVAELRQLFSTLNYELHISGVEKVIVFQADSILGLDLENSNHIKLPVDCQVWFLITSAEHSI